MTRATIAIRFGTSRCLDAVRGFRWSNDQSASRLNSMAAVRAHTMQASTRRNTRSDGKPPAATTNAPSANGNANTDLRLLTNEPASPVENEQQAPPPAQKPAAEPQQKDQHKSANKPLGNVQK